MTPSQTYTWWHSGTSVILILSYFSDPSFPLLISLKRNHSRVPTHLHNTDAQLFLRKLEAYSIPWTMG